MDISYYSLPLFWVEAICSEDLIPFITTTIWKINFAFLDNIGLIIPAGDIIA